MAAADRVEIGFSGGQVLSVRMSEDALRSLHGALGQSQGWTDVETQDGSVTLDLSQVVFVRLAAGDQRIGFAG